MRRKSISGITLVELIVSVALLAVIILTAVTALDFGGKSFFVLSRQGDIQTQASNIAAVISAQVRQSRSIINTAETRLDMVDGTGNSISIYLTGNNLFYGNQNTGETRILSDMAEHVSFIKTKNGVILEITLNDLKGQSYKFKTVAYKRF